MKAAYLGTERSPCCSTKKLLGLAINNHFTHSFMVGAMSYGLSSSVAFITVVESGTFVVDKKREVNNVECKLGIVKNLEWTSKMKETNKTYLCKHSCKQVKFGDRSQINKVQDDNQSEYVLGRI